MREDTGKVLAFRPREPASVEPAGEGERRIVRLAYVRDYGPPCNNMTVSLVRVIYADGDRLLLMLNGPDIDNVPLFFPDAMDADTRDLMGICLYRVLFHATAPNPPSAA